MASPFTIFRRHQKVMIAALVLLAMFAFVFLDPLLEAFRDDGPTTAAVVVTTRRYGDLREHELQSLIRQRQVVLNVFERALIAGGFPPQFAAFQVQQLFGPPSEESVVNSWLHARRAEHLGMVVDDSAVNEFLTTFLEQFTQGRVGLGELAASLRDDQIPQRVLFAALRNELLARQLRQSFETSLYATPPMQRWDYYQRLNRRATIELAPIPVVDFMDQIEDPGDRTLRAFFEEHKNRMWRPDMPEPAFREPKRIALQYFKADFDAFVDPEAVTAEEVALYYEENKDRLYLETQTPPFREPAMPPPVDPVGEPAFQAPAETTPTEPPADDAETTPESEETAPADQPIEPIEPPADEAMDEAGDEPIEPAEDSTDESAEESDADSPEPTDGAGAAPFSPNGAPVWLTSLIQAEEDLSGAPDEAMPQEAPHQEDPGMPVEDEPAGDDPDPASPEEPGPTDDDPADDDPAAPEPSTIDGRPATRFHLPLSEVEDDIRNRLARAKAHENIEQLLQRLRARMQRYHDALTLYEVHREAATKTEPPAELDMGELADEHGLESFETNLLSPWEARDLEIGDSLIDGAHPFLRFVFEDLPTFQPAISQGAEDWFLFWKTQEQEERVPEWQDGEVKRRVLEAWRLVQARDLARAHAQALAEKARAAGTSSLESFFADEPKYDVVQAGPFSWMTYGDLPPMLAQEPPRLAEVEGVDFTGHQFMRDVFALEEGELGVAMNQPQTFAYVVRIDSLVPPLAVLWEGFLVDDFGKYSAAGAPNLRQMHAAWQEQVEADAGLEWKREPWRGRDFN